MLAGVQCCVYFCKMQQVVVVLLTMVQQFVPPC